MGGSQIATTAANFFCRPRSSGSVSFFRNCCCSCLGELLLAAADASVFACFDRRAGSFGLNALAHPVLSSERPKSLQPKGWVWMNRSSLEDGHSYIFAYIIYDTPNAIKSHPSVTNSRSLAKLFASKDTVEHAILVSPPRSARNTSLLFCFANDYCPPLRAASRMASRASSTPPWVPMISMASPLRWSRGTWIFVPVALRMRLISLPPGPMTWR